MFLSNFHPSNISRINELYFLLGSSSEVCWNNLQVSAEKSVIDESYIILESEYSTGVCSERRFLFEIKMVIVSLINVKICFNIFLSFFSIVQVSIYSQTFVSFKYFNTSCYYSFRIFILREYLKVMKNLFECVVDVTKASEKCFMYYFSKQYFISFCLRIS